MSTPLRIGLLVESRYLSQPQPLGLVDALEAEGHSVTVLDPERSTTRIDAALVTFNVVIARGRSWGVQCLLALGDAQGTLTINRGAAVAAVHNKANMAVTLAAAGIPTPPTFLGLPQAMADTLDWSAYPLVLKPLFGDNGAGLQLVNTPNELAATRWPEPVALAQSIVFGRGEEVKVYAIGRDVWTLRRPARFAPPRGGRVRMNDDAPSVANLEYRDLAHRCGDAFGLELFGVDCIETETGPVVIEVNDFPNYVGIADASRRLAKYVVRRAAAGPQLRRPSCESGS